MFVLNTAMPRRTRGATGGYLFHVLNRSAGRGALFKIDRDFEIFEEIIHEGLERKPMRLLSYCIMPNHWHMVVWPRRDGELSEYLRWVTLTHTQRRHAQKQTSGTGPLYQGRFRSFPVQKDEHLVNLCRYVERNAVRANLVARAEDWRWSSLWHRHREDPAWLADWPVPRPRLWLPFVNRPESESELLVIRQCVQRGSPFGTAAWTRATAKRLGLESSLRPRGRPRKTEE